jgi:hypothetical protein
VVVKGEIGMMNKCGFLRRTARWLVRLTDLIYNAWWNPFREWSPDMKQLMGARCWWETISIIHPLPIVVAVFSTILMVYLPPNILSSNQVLSEFAKIMIWLVPGVLEYAKNTGSQAVLLTHAINWAFVPYWVFLTFRALPVFNIILLNDFKLVRKHFDKNFASIPKSQRSRSRIFFLTICGPFALGFGLWGLWIGFIFQGGPPSIAKGFVYESLFQYLAWNWFLPQAFVIFILCIFVFFAMLPISLSYIFTGVIK